MNSWGSIQIEMISCSLPACFITWFYNTITPAVIHDVASGML